MLLTVCIATKRRVEPCYRRQRHVDVRALAVAKRVAVDVITRRDGGVFLQDIDHAIPVFGPRFGCVIWYQT